MGPEPVLPRSGAGGLRCLPGNESQQHLPGILKTLILGIKCSDGIVLGADGAATYGILGQYTIRQPIKKKLRLLGSQLIVGVSGSVGIGQRIAGEIEVIQKRGIPFEDKAKQLSNCKPHEVMAALRQIFWRITGPEFDIARAMAQAIGSGAAIQNALTQAVVALLVENLPCLFHFDFQGMAEQATDDLPFVAIGSGQLIADPFLAFIRRIYWPERFPTVEQGIFAAVWAIQHAIETNAGGVGPPIQIVTFQKERDGAWRAKELPTDLNEERLQFISTLEKAIGDLPKQLEEARKSIPPPPAP